jgi:thiamin-phosphate kinase
MTLENVGEYKIHKWLQKLLNPTFEDFGVGDDCAKLNFTINDSALVSTDLTNINAGFAHAGKLCVIQNFSDIICKGGVPKALFVSLQLKKDTKFKELQELMFSLKQTAEFYGSEIKGGDIKESVVNKIVGTAVGTIHKENGIPRKGAQVNDIVAMTLTKNWKIGMRWAAKLISSHSAEISLQKRKKINKAYYTRWILPINEMQAIYKNKNITSAMDTSDGIGACLEIMSNQSRVGFKVFETQLTELIDPDLKDLSKKLNIPFWKWAFSPGFDWEVVMTIKAAAFIRIRNEVKKAGGDLLPLGQVVKGKVITFVDAEGSESIMNPFKTEMFSHFNREVLASIWLAHNDFIS